MRRALAVLALILAPSGATAQMRVIVSLRAFRSPVALDTLVVNHRIAATPRAVYLAAIEAFDSLNIPVNTKDEKRGIVAATRFVKMRNLAGNQMSAWFNCGAGMTGPHANEWRLDIAIAALIDPVADDGTRLGVATVASALDIAGSTNPVQCTPTGQLEEKLAEVIRLKVIR